MGQVRTMDIGDRYGDLVILGERTIRLTPGGRRMPYRMCECKCGKRYEVSEWALNQGVQSCLQCSGSRISKSKTRHGGSRRVVSRERLYGVWCDMKKRCSCESRDDYYLYGGRGISVCAEWADDYTAFREWAVANGYDPCLSIDRINTDGNYEPTNCRWATPSQQSNNKRSNVMVTAFGETRNVSQWAKDERCVVKVATLRQRIRLGWASDRAITEPPNQSSMTSTVSHKQPGCLGPYCTSA